MAAFTTLRVPTLHTGRVSSARVSKRGQLVIRAAKGGEEGGKVFKKDVYGTIAKNANYALVGAAMTKVGMEQALSGEGKEFTFFAPNDDAMADFCKESGVTKLALLDLPNLEEVVKGHAVEGKVTSADMADGKEMTTLAGTTLTFGAGPSVNGIALFKKDIAVDNGVVHALKKVIAN